MYKYKIRKVMAGPNGQKSQKYMAVGVRTREVDLDELAKSISHGSSFTPGVIRGVLTDLVRAVGDVLTTGDSVRLDDLGVFSLSLTSELYDTAEKVTPSKVSVSKLNFRANKDLKSRFAEIKFECVGKSGEK